MRPQRVAILVRLLPARSRDKESAFDLFDSRSPAWRGGPESTARLMQ